MRVVFSTISIFSAMCVVHGRDDLDGEPAALMQTPHVVVELTANGDVNQLKNEEWIHREEGGEGQWTKPCTVDMWTKKKKRGRKFSLSVTYPECHHGRKEIVVDPTGAQNEACVFDAHKIGSDIGDDVSSAYIHGNCKQVVFVDDDISGEDICNSTSRDNIYVNGINNYIPHFKRDIRGDVCRIIVVPQSWNCDEDGCDTHKCKKLLGSGERCRMGMKDCSLVKDENGCDICKCKKECSGLMTKMSCGDRGRVKDEDGCDTSTCKKWCPPLEDGRGDTCKDEEKDLKGCSLVKVRGKDKRVCDTCKCKKECPTIGGASDSLCAWGPTGCIQVKDEGCCDTCNCNWGMAEVHPVFTSDTCPRLAVAG